ncbi:MAG: molybdate transport system permease protein [Candidatus Sumerlaeota bacterium]|nr:molybdate transport system permease protein [Candidatus Sumerlaeota bacterium]
MAVRHTTTQCTHALRVLAFLLVLAVNIATAEAPPELTVAVAASAQPPLRDLAASFEQQTGAHVTITAGSTGVLRRQAQEGAPFDLFFAADWETPVALGEEGVLLKDSVVPYARGRLVLWQRGDAAVQLRAVSDLALLTGENRRLAIANPQLAPYGQAAMETLASLGLAESLDSHLILGENVRHTHQIAESGNADAAFVAASIAQQSDGRTIDVPMEAYAPLLQGVGIMASSADREQASAFLAFVLSSNGQSILARHGFLPPGDSPAEKSGTESRAPRPLDWRPVWISLRVGIVATLAALLLGASIGYSLSNWRFPGGRVFEAVVLLPLVLPPTVMGYYLLVLIGQRGPIGQAWESVFGGPLVFTINAAIAAATVATIPIVATQLRAAFATLDPEVTEAARLDGAHGPSLFLHIMLPQIRLPLAAAGAIAFARSVGDFGTTLMVAGSLPGKTQTASIAIYELMNEGRDREALLLVVMISVVSMMVLILTAGKRLTPA